MQIIEEWVKIKLQEQQTADMKFSSCLVKFDERYCALVKSSRFA